MVGDRIPKHPIVKIDPHPDKGKVRITALLHQDAFGPHAVVPSITEKNRYCRMTLTFEQLAALPVCTYKVVDGRVWITHRKESTE